MKKLFLASVAALFLATGTGHAADDDVPPPPPRFRPWQQVWQCNDIRVTVTARDPFSIEYDLGGIIEKYGGLNNASAYIGMMPTRKLGIVILSNRGNQYPNEPGRRILLELAAAGE